MFDPSAFMEQSVDGPMETQRRPVPAGEYVAMVGDFVADEKTFRQVEIKNGQRAGATVTIFRCPFEIQDEALKADMGRDKIVVYKDYWLDFQADGMTLATGKDDNIDLGSLRAAVGQNDGTPWNFSRLRNAGPVKVITTLRADPKDPEIKYAEVKRVGTVS